MPLSFVFFISVYMYISPVAIFCRGIILGVEPAEMGPLSNMRKVNQTSIYLKKI